MKLIRVGRISLIAAAGVAIAAVTAGSLAFDGRHTASGNRATRSVVVNYADLDLAKEAGANTLYQRLNTAARRVCGTRDTRFIEDVRDWKRCNGAALEGAVSEVGNARLTALHETKAGIRKQPLVPIAGLP